jgi:hypothetical protein
MSGTTFNFNVQNLNGLTFDWHYVAGIGTSVETPTYGTAESVQGGTIYTNYSIPVDQNTTGGLLSFYDNENGTAPNNETPTISVAAFNANAPNIVEYTLNYADGTTVSFGGEVVGESADGNSFLVDQIPNFVDTGSGTWSGNLSTNNYLIFSNIDQSQTENYNDNSTPAPGPNSPEVFGENTNFSYAPQPTYSSQSPPCFAAGTRILTTRGERRVEALRVGDAVVLATGGTSKITWIGRRRVDCRRHPMPESAQPICIAPGAFADFQPRRRLLLSPEHCVYVKDSLIPVRLLINGSSVVQLSVDEVVYYHVELAQHAILFAEGLPTESYLDTGNRGIFENGGEPVVLHPDLRLLCWDGLGCAPLTVTGPIVQHARTVLAARAALGVRVARQRRKVAA